MKKHLPNILTLINLNLGLIAICIGLENPKNLFICSWLILIGMIFDFLDGALARILKVDSNYGKQLDSFADMITFGVAPAIIIFQMIREHNNEVAYIAFLIPMFSALRLAKYNIDQKQGSTFTGLTTTANALFFSSLPLIKKFQSFEFVEKLLSNSHFLFILTIGFSLLLISNINTFSLKFYSSNNFEKKIKISFIILCRALMFFLEYLALPIIIFFYILLSIIFNPK